MTNASELLEGTTPRFYIDHGMIHDRETGKHVSTEPIEVAENEWENTPAEEACHLLNNLARQVTQLEAQLAEMRRFVSSIASNDSDPLEPIADNGMTVWDGIKNEARALLTKEPK